MTLKETILFRAKLLINNTRGAVSSCDVHETAEIRHTATMLVHAVEDNEIDLEVAFKIITRLETRQVDFFKKKYSNIYKGKLN